MSPAADDTGAMPRRGQPPALTRRTFLVAGGTALLLGIAAPAPAQRASTAIFGEPQLAAWLEFLPDGRVVIALPDAEMGQGVYTGLPLILADELGADWSRVEVRHSGADDRLANPMKGFQATGRSLSTRGYYALLRRVGATARVLFTGAAAAQLGVPADELRVEGGAVRHARSGRSLPFADLIAMAGLLPLPLDVRLRPRRELALIGRDVPALDAPAKVTGTAGFAADVRLPGLRVAAIRHGPGFGASPRRVDAAALAGDPAFTVVELPGAVAVVAPDFWQASRALDRLRIEWGPAPGAGASSPRLAADRSAALAEGGITARDDGDVEAAFAGAASVSADYDVPYLAHATMEPMGCTAWLHDGLCEVWAPTQGPGRLRNELARVLGLDPGRIRIHRMFLGGGFGRRWQVDFGVQAALIARGAGGPVKLLWSRTEDLQHDFYRPAMTMRVRGALRDRRLAALDVTLAGALLSGWGKPAAGPPQPDAQLLGGFATMPYRLPDYRIRWVPRPAPVPIGVWRSVAYSHNVFALECALDELAAAAGVDPVAFRRPLLAEDPRALRVLSEAARRGGLGRPLPPGTGRGIALSEYAGSPIAQVAEVTVTDGRLRVRRVTAVIDCGLAVQPDRVRAQVEGGIVFGLSAALRGAIDIEDGEVRQANFNDYPLVTLADCPDIDVTVLESGELPMGVGEAGTPAIAPAVCNAIAAATGARVRTLPLLRAGFSV
ncbi:MAG: xanthine dehydrogenase family protein molybdopterin-binding subunit [Chromatiales bacterium]|jgi:isoquinoline 1-oxidoreductase beta subunit|nr:xanthine dehydrogenase family protein molybdopterin-binding subunit [Chromatiales bacterium]